MTHQDFSLWEDSNQELLSICKSDNAFNIVYSKMQKLYPDFHYMHMFSSPPLCFDQALAKFSPLLNLSMIKSTYTTFCIFILREALFLLLVESLAHL